MVGFLVLLLSLAPQHALQFLLPILVELHKVPEGIPALLIPGIETEGHVLQVLLFGSAAKADPPHNLVQFPYFHIDCIEERVHLTIKVITLLVRECLVGVRGVGEIVLPVLREDSAYFLKAQQDLGRLLHAQLCLDRLADRARRRLLQGFRDQRQEILSQVDNHLLWITRTIIIFYL